MLPYVYSIYVYSRPGSRAVMLSSLHNSQQRHQLHQINHSLNTDSHSLAWGGSDTTNGDENGIAAIVDRKTRMGMSASYRLPASRKVGFVQGNSMTVFEHFPSKLEENACFLPFSSLSYLHSLSSTHITSTQSDSPHPHLVQPS